MLAEPLRHVGTPGFGAVIFRRTDPELTALGGLWDESFDLYGGIGAVPLTHKRRWLFEGGGSVGFAHMQYEQDLLKWHSSQIPLIEFDELTTFVERQFVYMLSRNRSTCGVRPYVRGSCNPDADSWVAKWVDWWIDPQTGYPIPDRAGVVRWFVRDGETLRWAATRDDLRREYPDKEPKSFTFVPARLEDNKILEAKDPGYRSNLDALPSVDRERLLKGNWKVRAGGTWFDRAAAAVVPCPAVGTTAVRYWDTAASVGETACWTAGVLLGRQPDGRFVIVDVVRGRWEPLDRDAAIVATAHADRGRRGLCVPAVWVEQEPGGSGLADAQSLVRKLAGFNAHAWKETGDKDVRIKPFAAQWQGRNVLLCEGGWVADYLSEMGRIPGGKVRDQADATAGAFNRLVEGGLGGGEVATAPARETEFGRLPASTWQ